MFSIKKVLSGTKDCVTLLVTYKNNNIARTYILLLKIISENNIVTKIK